MFTVKKTLHPGETLYLTATYGIVIIAVLATLYPLLYVISMSISTASKVIAGEVWLLPKGFNPASYQVIFSDSYVWRAYLNTVAYAGISTVFTVVATFMAAYPLSRTEFFLRKPLTVFITIPMLISGGMIPTYLLMRNLGLYDNLWAMVLPGVVTTWNVVLVKTYIKQNIHESILEAARMDGANDARLLFGIVMPLAKPIMAIIALYSIVAHWNSYMNVLLYMPSAEKQTIQLYMMKVLVRNSNDLTQAAGSMGPEFLLDAPGIQLKYALIVVASAPVMTIYLFLHKYFEKGIAVGSVKD